MKHKPNILIAVWHDCGRHFGCYGVQTINTPNVDALAADGLRCTNHFSTSTVCSPSRASLLTGRYPQSHGLLGLAHAPSYWVMNDGERHLTHYLRDEGYHTCLCGWQHETTHETIDTKLAFDEKYHHDPLPDAGTVAGSAIEFLRSRRGRTEPFYLQVGFWEAHVPFNKFGLSPPDTSRGVDIPGLYVDNDAARETFARLQGDIRFADGQLGTILDELRSLGLEENTLVVFTIDHGYEVTRAKATLYDTGIAVPLIMRWPGGGIAGGTTYEGLTSHVDFIPTLFRLLGKDVPDRVEGVDFAPTAGTGREEAGRREIHAIWHGNDSRCIRTEQYKLIRNFSPRRRVVTPIDLSGPRYENWFGGGGPVPSAELYDIKADPWEMNDLAGSSGHAAVFRDLNQRLYAWMSRVNDPILQGRMVDPWYRAAIADFKSQST